jgi:hypothetical protein
MLTILNYDIKKLRIRILRNIIPGDYINLVAALFFLLFQYFPGRPGTHKED